MVVIYTGSNEIDKILEAEIKGSMVVSYEDFIIEDDKFKDQTVILGANSIERDLKEYLFLLRSKNIRVILLLDNDKNEKTKTALEYGIYDLVFGNFYPSQIVEILNNPKRFSDISKIYRRRFDIHIKKNRRNDYKYEKK